ncbi:MAG: diguanylate cyclase [Aquabacterium sp.]
MNLQSPHVGLSALLVACLGAAAAVIYAHVKSLQGRERGWHALVRAAALSHDAKQATLTLRFLVGAINALIGVLALNYGAEVGVIDSAGCLWLTGFALTVTGGMYVALRSGWNRRLADPSMAAVQLIVCEAFLAWGYVLGGIGRPIALLLLFIFLLFNMFTSTMRVLIRACMAACLLFGTAMAYVAWQEPHIPGIEVPYVMAKLQVAYFCVMAVMLASLCLMVKFLTQIRARSSQRKAELTDALVRIQKLATRDDLTGMFNRRHMLELMDKERARCQRDGGTFSLALIDVDHFKSVNDTYGHGVGDEVLKAVSGVIFQALRDTDAVARWGGEEFLLMFVNTDLADAERGLLRIRTLLAQTAVSERHGALRITVSAGVTGHDPQEPLACAIDRADRALYAAKLSGRDRVLVASSAPCEPPSAGRDRVGA